MAGEVVAVGFWLGDESSRAAGFYAYVTPPPDGIEEADFGVEGAAYVPGRGLIALPWDVARTNDDPHATVRFADAVYDAAVELGGWPADLVGPRHDGWYASRQLVFTQS